MTQAPDEKIVEEMVDAAMHAKSDHPLYIIEAQMRAALAAARPLLEAEIRKDERWKMIEAMLELACQRDDDWHRNARQFLRNFVDTRNLDLTTDSKNGEG